jgi:hypothetical protein
MDDVGIQFVCADVPDPTTAVAVSQTTKLPAYHRQPLWLVACFIAFSTVTSATAVASKWIACVHMIKVIDVSDEAEPLPKGYGFPAPEPELDLGPDAAAFDFSPISRMNAELELVGMAPKWRDPAAVLLIQTFIARHGLRLVGFLPQLPARPFRCDGPLWPPTPWRPDLTRFPPRATVTDKGKRYSSQYEEARARRYKPVEGEAAYKAQEKIRNNAGVYEDRLSVQESEMSLGDGKYSRLAWDSTNKVYRQAVPKSQKLPKEGKLPERSCQNPECVLEIDENRHHNVKYCDDECAARGKELRRLHRNKLARRPILYRNESDVSVDLTNDTSQLEQDVISPHINRGIVSKDCPAEVVVYPQ